LYFGKPLFIPLACALFISFILYPVCKKLESKGVSKALAASFGVGILFLFGVVLVSILYMQLVRFATDWGEMSSKLSALMDSVKSYFINSWNLNPNEVERWSNDLVHSLAARIFSLVETFSISFFINVVMLILIPIYVFLILYYRHLLVELVLGFFPKERTAKMREVVVLAVSTYYGFIKGMLVVYFTVGVLNSIGLLLLGIPHAILFGFLTAIMTFIPYIGIVVASLLPISYAWITYDSAWYPLGVVAVFAFVQYLEANLIFPWAVSQRLKLNTLATLIVIIAGGVLWGAAGMILFVPFAAILRLVAERTEGWEGLARFLGQEKVCPNRLSLHHGEPPIDRSCRAAIWFFLWNSPFRACGHHAFIRLQLVPPGHGFQFCHFLHLHPQVYQVHP
ncbi:MAG: AI-2E family transporter, partial [Bacteroidota bacterium]